jgi:transposase
MQAMTKHGWIPTAKLVFKSTRKTGDEHGPMKHDLLRKWCSEQLRPNLPKNSLIMMAHAPYHKALSLHAAPTARGKKDAIHAGFSKNRLPVREDGLKAELVDILEKVAPAPTYAREALASAQGHEILRTPPYHPELQPIETCWAGVKNQIARKSKFTLAHLLEQRDDAFANGTEETCTGLIQKVREVEDKYWREEAQLDREQ